MHTNKYLVILSLYDPCSLQEQLVYKDDACCPDCVEDWLWVEEGKEEIKDVEVGSDLTLECSSVVKPNNVVWLFSNDGGENFTELEEGARGLTLKIKKISAENNGKRNCSLNMKWYYE